MLSNLPPGVTGNEYAIGGAQQEWSGPAELCPVCDKIAPMFYERHYEFGLRMTCPECDEITYIFEEETDEDEAYDRMRDDALTEGDRT